MNRRKIIGFLSVLFILVQCTKTDQSPKIPKDALATADGQYIMPKDLAYRLDFTPVRQLSGLTPRAKKEAYLQPLIDEMLLAAGAEDLRLDTNRTYQLKVREIEKDEVREALYFKEVESKTDISEQQYAEALRRSRQELLLNYMTFETREEAEYIRSLIARGEADFQEAFEIAYKAGIEPPSVNVRWGQMQPRVEDQVFELERGQITDIIETPEGFMIMQLDSLRDITPRSTEKFEEQTRSVRQRLEERVLNMASRRYVVHAMENVSLDVLNDGVEILRRYIERRQPEKSASAADSLRTQLPLREIRWELDLPAEQKRTKLVTFNGNTWQVRDFLEVARGRGVKMPDKTKSVPVWLKNTLGQFIRDEVLADIGYQQGLDTTATVRHKVNRWKNYYRSNLYAEYLESHITENRDYSGVLRNTLDSLKAVYSPQINTRQLEEIDLNESQMIVMKRGSFNRLAVPPYPQTFLELYHPNQDTLTQN